MRPANPEAPVPTAQVPASSAAVAIAILAKAPTPGLAKTRLIPHLGADGAAALQRWLLQRSVATALTAAIGPVHLWCTPDTEHPDFSRCRSLGPLTLHRQPAGDLGQRMQAAVAGAAGVAGTLVIGTDCPLLTPDLLARAADCLRAGDDAVVFPAEDGGYVLIGLRRAAPAAFANIPWGSETVMAATRTRLDALGWRWSRPVELWDVDRPADYERLAQHLPAVRACCRAT